MALAEKKIEPAPPKGALPVPQNLIALNTEVADLLGRVVNLQAALDRGAIALRGFETEKVTLAHDEAEKLQALSTAESLSEDTKPLRDALESIRNRVALVGKKASEIVADQAGRQVTARELKDELSALTAQQDKMVRAWRNKCYREIEAQLRLVARYAVDQWFLYRYAAGDQFPPIQPHHSGIWFRNELRPDSDTSKPPLLVRGNMLKETLENYARGVTTDD